MRPLGLCFVLLAAACAPAPQPRQAVDWGGFPPDPAVAAQPAPPRPWAELPLQQRVLHRAIREYRQVPPSSAQAQEIARVGAEEIVEGTPGAPPRPARLPPRNAVERTAAAAWEAAVLREQATLLERMQSTLASELRAAERHAREERQHRYCSDLADDIAASSAPTGQLTARLLFGTELPRRRGAYNSCMSGFRRTDDYLGR